MLSMSNSEIIKQNGKHGPTTTKLNETSRYLIQKSGNYNFFFWYFIFGNKR